MPVLPSYKNQSIETTELQWPPLDANDPSWPPLISTEPHWAQLSSIDPTGVSNEPQWVIMTFHWPIMIPVYLNDPNLTQNYPK